MHFPTSWRARACFRSSFVQPALIAATLLGSLPCATAALAGDTYSFTQIGIPNVTGVSSNGVVVVGNNIVGGHYQAFSYDGTVHPLGTLGGSTTLATAVSANGAVIVGSSDTGGNVNTDVFSYYGGLMHDLGFDGRAQGVSADGTVIVGYSYTLGTYQAFSYAMGTGVRTDLPFLPGGGTSYAHGVSADGKVVVGNSATAINQHAFRYSNGVMVDLGALGDSTTAPGTASSALAISADGVVTVGSSNRYPTPLHYEDPTPSSAVMWTGTAITDLGTLGGDEGVATLSPPTVE